MVKPGLDLIQIVFALLKLGAVPVVIDPGMGLGRFLNVQNNQKVGAIIGGKAIALSKWFLRTNECAKNAITINAQFKRRVKKHLGANQYDAFEAEADDLAAVLFTSGSTKGVCLPTECFMRRFN